MLVKGLRGYRALAITLISERGAPASSSLFDRALFALVGGYFASLVQLNRSFRQRRDLRFSRNRLGQELGQTVQTPCSKAISRWIDSPLHPLQGWKVPPEQGTCVWLRRVGSALTSLRAPKNTSLTHITICHTSRRVVLKRLIEVVVIEWFHWFHWFPLVPTGSRNRSVSGSSGSAPYRGGLGTTRLGTAQPV